MTTPPRLLLLSTKILPSLPPATTTFVPGKKSAPPDPKSVSPIFNVFQLPGVKKSRRFKVCGASFSRLLPKLLLPSKVPLPVGKYKLPVASKGGGGAPIQHPASGPPRWGLKD